MVASGVRWMTAPHCVIGGMDSQVKLKVGMR
jgi:hypothetical protein